MAARLRAVTSREPPPSARHGCLDVQWWQLSPSSWPGSVLCSALLCSARRRRVHMSAAPQQAQLTSRSRSVLGKRFNSFGSGRFNPFTAWPRGNRRHRGGGREDGHGESAPSAFNRLWLSCCVEPQVRLSPNTRVHLCRRRVCEVVPLPLTPPHPTSHPNPFPNGNSWPVLAFQKARHVMST